jgi:hypothetical protein
MEISIIAPVTPALPPMPPGVESGSAYEPPDTSRLTESADDAHPVLALEDGGVAIGLDPDDDLSLAPQWLAWMEWVDAGQPYLDVPVHVGVAPSARC